MGRKGLRTKYCVVDGTGSGSQMESAVQLKMLKIGAYRDTGQANGRSITSPLRIGRRSQEVLLDLQPR